MKEDDVVKIIRDFISKKFPMDCSCCGKRFNSFAEYLRNTTHLGKPMSYDAQSDNWQPEKPIGTFSMANCSCGTTITISSRGMNLWTLWKLMRWGRKQALIRGVEISNILEELRIKIDKSVLQDEIKKSED